MSLDKIKYADGAARGTARGTLAMCDDGANIQSVAGDTDGHLQVDVLSGTVSTKHDAATYKTAIFNAAADGNIVAAVADKIIKVHYLDVQAQGTVTVTIRNDDVAGAILDVWKLEDREGAVKAFLPYPASHYVTSQVAGDALYCDVSAAVTVKICVVYTDADAA